MTGQHPSWLSNGVEGAAVLRIKDIEFEVDRQRSSVSAYIPQQPQDPPERLCWSIEVECVEKDYERGFWVPKLYAQDISIKTRDWRRLEGEEVREEGDRLAAYLYVQEHERTR